jgi:Protein of unknown function (DUF4089)
MNDKELDEFISAGGALLGIPIAPEWQPAIRMNIAASLIHAAMVVEFVLPDDAEPAAVFRP